MEEIIQSFYTFEYSQLTRVIVRTRKTMIIKLSFFNQKTRKMRRGEKVSQTKSI